MDHLPADRGCPDRHDPPREAGREDLDPDLPRQADHQEAGRDPDGHREGRGGVLRGGGEARPHPLRDGGDGREAGPRRAEAGAGQAPGPDPHRPPLGSVALEGRTKMATAKELHDLTLDDLQRRATELRESLFKDRLKLRTGALESPAKRNEARRDLARILTVITQKEKAAAAKA